MDTRACDCPPLNCLEWDACAQACGAGFMQSWAWAAFYVRQGYHATRWGVWVGDRLVGGAVFYDYPHDIAANLLLSPGGPFFLSGCEAVGMAVLLEKARSLAQEIQSRQNRHVIGWRIEPVIAAETLPLDGFARAPVDMMPVETLLIDLRPDEASILAAMHPKGRYNIRLADRHQVCTHFTTDSQAIPTFYDLFWETVERHRFFGESYGFFINLCQTLFAAECAEIGIATYHDRPVATMILLYWGDRAIYLYGGSDPEARSVMAPYALHWAAMRRAKTKGYLFYDFYGFTQNPNHSYAKFSQFKRKFGGQVKQTIGAQDYFFYDQLADTVVTVLQQMHRRT